MSFSLISAIIALLQIGTASAQAVHTWVSGVGDDVNPCSRTAPCKTFAGAISKTAAGGEINCLDPGGFGALTVVKSIAIICQNGTVTAPGISAITVNAGASDTVILNGLDLQGDGTGLAGINFIKGRVLHVEHCRISGFRAGLASGILFEPAAGTTGILLVSDTIVSENGGGIIIKPAGTGAANAQLIRVLVDSNSTGVEVNGTSGAGFVNATLTDSRVANNANAGTHAIGQTGNVRMFVIRTTSAGNGTGLLADGSAAFISVENSTVLYNGIGASAINGSPGVFTYKNNVVDASVTTNGTLTPSALQ